MPVDGVVLHEPLVGCPWSLVHMQQVLAKRPPLFKSVEAAVRWALKTKMMKNAEAAAVSLPSQLAATEKGHW